MQSYASASLLGGGQLAGSSVADSQAANSIISVAAHARQESPLPLGLGPRHRRPIEPPRPAGNTVDRAANDVGPICVLQRPEGGPLPLLPDGRAQLGDEVRHDHV